MSPNYSPEDNKRPKADPICDSNDSDAAQSSYITDLHDTEYDTSFQPRRAVAPRRRTGLVVLFSIVGCLLLLTAGAFSSFFIVSTSIPLRLGLTSSNSAWYPPSSGTSPATTTATTSVASSAATTAFVAVKNPPSIVIEETPVEPATEPVYDETGRQILTIPQIAAKAMPSVVGIMAYPYTDTNDGVSFGSGIVMSEDGYILTNTHVVESGVSFKVILHDSSEYEAQRIAYDAKSDIAILKIEADGLTPAEFGDTTALVVGDLAVAIGNPSSIDLAGTTTSGIISAVDREIVVDSSGNKLKLIQTDAAINPGNSGGPLLNKYGQVIGINTVKMNSSYYEGLCFAIPTTVFKPIVDELFEKGFVSGYPSIGISGLPVTAADQAYGIPAGVYVSIVNEKSDAYLQGIESGDVITHVNGTAVFSISDINLIKNTFKVGDQITLTIFRSEESFDVTITLCDESELK